MSRLDDLKWALGVARDSISEADPDKRSPLIGQYRALLADISEIEGEAPAEKGEVNGLVILQEELAKRQQSGTASTLRPARRGV